MGTNLQKSGRDVNASVPCVFVCVRLEAHHRHKNNMPTLSGRIWATLPHSAWRPPPPLLCARASATSTSHHRTPWPVRPACCATRERGNVGYVSIRGMVPPPCAGSPPSSWLLIPFSRCSPSSRLSHCQCVLRTLSSSHLFLPILFSHCHSHCISLIIPPPTSK